jgi:Protein of unknown function (DUF3014)
MSRYVRNEKKSAKSTFFVIPMVLAFLIAVSGSFFVIKLLKRPESPNVEKAIPRSDKLPVAEGGLTRNEISSYPIQPPPQAPVKAPVELDLSQLFGLKTVLPDLLGSDDWVRKTVAKLSPGLAQWLAADQLIRRYTLIINDFAQGIRVSKNLTFIRLDEPFTVVQEPNGLYIAPKSYRRYDALTRTLQAINAKAAVAVYQKVRPLMLQVFAAFSYPKDITLESVVSKALNEILVAPVIDGPVALVRPSLFYKFADPKLEALGPVQKQMLRMGPENTRVLQQKCREFLVELARKPMD